MGFLAGKRLLITGVISNRSIAYGIAAACKREGAELAFTYQGERIKDRVTDFAREFGSSLVFPCDVGSDEQIDALFAELGKHWDGFDGLVHSIAFAPKEALSGDYLSCVTRENFRIAHDISSYSFAALAKAALPMMEGRKAALLTLSYLGAIRSAPNYNVMGLAKASLESNVYYMAQSLGPKVSAGPINAAGGQRHCQFQRKARSRRQECATAPQCDHRRSRQCRRLPALRPGLWHYRRNHLRRRRVQYHCQRL